MYLARIDWIKDILDVANADLRHRSGRQTDRLHPSSSHDADQHQHHRRQRRRHDPRCRQSATPRTSSTSSRRLKTRPAPTLAAAFRAHMQATYGYARLCQTLRRFRRHRRRLRHRRTPRLDVCRQSQPEILDPSTHQWRQNRRRSRTSRAKAPAPASATCFAAWKCSDFAASSPAAEWLYFDEDGLIQDVRHEQ
ncbi:MAG: hypothetical protein MZU97_26485 [Bacillus subtilis]|nr:hypothetical protein [Bacillus subtilis]